MQNKLIKKNKNASYPIDKDRDIIINSILEFHRKMTLSAYSHYKNDIEAQIQLAYDIIGAKIQGKKLQLLQQDMEVN